MLNNPVKVMSHQIMVKMSKNSSQEKIDLLVKKLHMQRVKYKEIFLAIKRTKQIKLKEFLR